MCGRFTQRFSWREVHRFMNLTGPALNLRPRYNVAPGQAVAAVRAQDGERRLSMLRWGLIPVWSRQPNIAYRLIGTMAFAACGSGGAFRMQLRCRARWPSWRRARDVHDIDDGGERNGGADPRADAGGPAPRVLRRLARRSSGCAGPLPGARDDGPGGRHVGQQARP